MLFWVWKCNRGHLTIRPEGQEHSPAICGQAYVVSNQIEERAQLTFCGGSTFTMIAGIEGNQV